MWLRKLVAASMIITLLGMNILMVAGLLEDTTPVAGPGGSTSQIAQSGQSPQVTIAVEPNMIPAGSDSTITWSAPGDGVTCEAFGDWSGAKTQFGAEDTGTKTAQKSYTYGLRCTNEHGTNETSASMTVGPATSQPSTTPSQTQPAQTTPKVTYCEGMVPCYGKSDLAKHTSKGNCWGWNNKRVINITGFDAAYHIAKSNVSTIEVSDICGKDLAPALSGQIGASGKPGEDHEAATKANQDANMLPYIVGYYDANKP